MFQLEFYVSGRLVSRYGEFGSRGEAKGEGYRHLCEYAGSSMRNRKKIVIAGDIMFLLKVVKDKGERVGKKYYIKIVEREGMSDREKLLNPNLRCSRKDVEVKKIMQIKTDFGNYTINRGYGFSRYHHQETV